MKYIFILGQSPDLAKQEILSILANDSEKIITISQNFILAESDKSSDQLIKILGGTIKIALLVDNLKDLGELDAGKWESYLTKQLSEEKKNHFGFSIYNGSAKEYQKISQVALQLKRKLKDKYRVRFVTSKREELSSVIVAKNDLLGNELIIIKHLDENNTEYLLGLTQSVQDFEAYGKRDFDRPGRDSKSGMLPPKLAQMMLNLAGPNRKLNLLDPFCGSGTILQEALLMDYQTIYGSDREEKAIADSRTNIDWLRKNFPTKSRVEIEKINVKNLNEHFKDKKIGLIVTEPFMGDARFVVKQSRIEDLYKLKADLQELYSESFHQFKKILTKNAKVVFVFPIFNIRGEKLYTLNKKTLTDIGFTIIKPDIKSGNLSPDGNIIYNRPGQRVEREISVWQNK